MKKILISVITLAISIFVLCGCNKNIIDLQYKFTNAQIVMPNGDIIEGEVTRWCDYDDGDQIQVEMGNVVYLVHSSDVVLYNKK